MKTLIKVLSVSLLVGWLSGCDDGSAAGTKNSTLNGQTVSLLEGGVTLTLPKKLRDQRGNLEAQTNNMFVYADTSGWQSAIVILSDDNDESTQTLIDELEKQQLSRDDRLQTLQRNTFNIGQHQLQRLDTLTQTKDRSVYSSIILMKLRGKLITLQINMPADNLSATAQAVEQIIQSIQINVLTP